MKMRQQKFSPSLYTNMLLTDLLIQKGPVSSSFSSLLHEILHDGTTSDAQNHELEQSRPVVRLK